MLHTFIPSVLQEAEAQLQRLEKHYGLSTADFLAASPDSPSLKDVDGFDLIEWSFRADQAETLRNRRSRQSFSYAHTDSTPLANNCESEPALAA